MILTLVGIDLEPHSATLSASSSVDIVIPPMHERYDQGVHGQPLKKSPRVMYKTVSMRMA
jgi:hypothetical protein